MNNDPLGPARAVQVQVQVQVQTQDDSQCHTRNCPPEGDIFNSPRHDGTSDLRIQRPEHLLPARPPREAFAHAAAERDFGSLNNPYGSKAEKTGETGERPASAYADARGRHGPAGGAGEDVGAF